MKQFVRDGFTKAGLFTDHGPIVGVNANASNPHYEPSEGMTAPIHLGDVVLLDLWAKLDQPGSVYYDITWTHFMGETVPDEVQNVFETVTGARDAAIERVTGAIAAGYPLRGFEVDDAARAVIRDRGFGRISSRIAPATPSARTCTAMGRTWTTSKITTSGGCRRGPAFRSNRAFICRVRHPFRGQHVRRRGRRPRDGRHSTGNGAVLICPRRRSPHWPRWCRSRSTATGSN